LGLLLRLFLLQSVQLLVAGGLLGERLLGSQLAGFVRLSLALLLQTLLLLFLLLGLLDLFFVDQPGLQQLVAQRHAHGVTSSKRPDTRQASIKGKGILGSANPPVCAFPVQAPRAIKRVLAGIGIAR